MALDFPASPTTGQTYVSGGQIWTYNGSGWASSYQSSGVTRQQFTATAGQTSFTVTGGYLANLVDVYQNGVKLINGTDVTVTSGTAVVLAVGATVGDVIEVIGIATWAIANALPLTGGTITGNLNITGTETVTGTIVSTGANSGLQLNRRDTSAVAYTVYSSGGGLQFYSNSAGADKFALDSAGALYVGSTPSAGSAGQKLISNGAGVASTWGSSIVSGSKVTLSGTATPINTTIPSWVKRITLSIQGLSSSGTADYQVQIGSGSYTSTGYTSYSNEVSSTGGPTTSSSGFVIRNNEGAAQLNYGHMVLTLHDAASNTWVASHSLGGNNSSTKYFGLLGGGVVALSGVLDRLQITAGGTDTFDAGSVNILYE